MTTDTVYFKSREHDHKAYVHVHTDFHTVFLNDKKILNVFGDTVYSDQEKVATIYRATEAPDVHECHKAIARQRK